MKIGFTGTQSGMTERQQKDFVRLIQELNPTEFHHGDCVGADAQANDFVHIAFRDKVPIVIHPPKNPSKRAWCNEWAEMRPQRDYLERNHNIVDETDVLIATPAQDHEITRSGTWSTVRYATKQNKKVYLLLP